MKRVAVLFLLLTLIVISCGHPEVKIDSAIEDEIHSGLLNELEIASKYDENIDLTDDEIYALADYLMPFIVGQIEQRGNEAIELYYMYDSDE